MAQGIGAEEVAEAPFLALFSHPYDLHRFRSDVVAGSVVKPRLQRILLCQDVAEAPFLTA